MALFAGYLPLLFRFGTEQWARPQYQFFPLMLLAAAYLGWQRIRELPAGVVAPGSKTPTRMLLAASLFILLTASVLWSGRLAAISAWVAVAGMAWHLGGRAVLRAISPSLILLALIIGPPVGTDEPFLQHLRELAVWTSSSTLVWLNVTHLVTGTIIEIPGQRLLVAEACSGINSLMAVLGCTLVLGFWRRRSPGIIVSLLIAGVLFVLWANIVRIAGGAWLKVNWNIDILSGDVHQLASVVLFAVCMALVMSADEAASMARWWFAADPADALPATAAALTPDPPPVFTAPITNGMWAVALVFILAGAAQMANAMTHGGVAVWFAEPGASHLRADATFAVPQQIAGWKRSPDAEKLIAQPEIEGKRSQVWAYQQGDLIALVAIDYPFAGYHDLTICYQNGGWTIQQANLKTQRETEPRGAYTADLVNRLNERGCFLFAAVDEQGQWVPPPKTRLSEKLQERLTHLGRPDWNGCTYQIQLWAHSFAPVTDAQQQQLTQLFLAIRPELARQIVGQLRGMP